MNPKQGLQAAYIAGDDSHALIAAGIAEKMSGGTVGDADMDSGESAEAEDEVEDMAEEIAGE